MAYAIVSDVSVRLGQALTSDESLRVQALIDDVSALVTTFCRGPGLATAPVDLLKAVVCAEVVRAVNANPGILSENIGEIHTQYSAFRFALSADARSVLKPFRRNKFGSVSAKGGGLAV